MIFQTWAAQIRSLTAATLIAQNTIAETRVEQERTLPLAEGELPHLNVMMDESGEGQYQGAPRFLVTGRLQIKATVQRALLVGALGDLDALMAQVKDALFGDPVWLAKVNQILMFGVTATFKSNENQNVGEALFTLSCQWLETVTIRGAGALTGVDTTINFGVPGVTAPLTAVNNLTTS